VSTAVSAASRATTGAPRAPRLSRHAQAYLFLLPMLLVLLLFAAYPLLDGIWVSLTSRAVGRPGEFIGLGNFRKLMDDEIFRGAAWNSLTLTVTVVGAKLVLGLAAATLLMQRFPLRGLARTLVLLPWAVPALIATMGWRWLLDEQFGAINAWGMELGLFARPVDWLSDPRLGMVSIAIASVWQGLPFWIMMFLGAMMSVPQEQYEAAAIDGAGAWRSWRHVTLPGIADVVAVTLMLSTIWTFNSFHTVYVLTQGGPADRTHILPTLAYQYGLQRSELGLGSAVLVTVLPLFVGLIVLLTRRMLREKGVA
jgi:multiple sugar transport system permease protein